MMRRKVFTMGKVSLFGLSLAIPFSTPAWTAPRAFSGAGLSAIWANDGGDKVTQEELRATKNARSVRNSLWDGSQIQIFGAKNEVIAFNLILEAAKNSVKGLSVQLNRLEGPNGFVIQSSSAIGDQVFQWTSRDIELFYVRYLQIKGLSLRSYETYDERHIPKRFQRPWWGERGIGEGTWNDRPDHDRFYPEIAVPLELHPTFDIDAGKNQSIWADVYIPKEAPTGEYKGEVTISQAGGESISVPVLLKVLEFTLPDRPTSKTMVHLGYGDVNMRYTGLKSPGPGSEAERISRRVRDRHFQLARRHKITLVDSDLGSLDWTGDRPRREWFSRLDGSLFSERNGYRGPGEGLGNDVYTFGSYDNWNWQREDEASYWRHSDNWVKWFESHFPETLFFLSLPDEHSNPEDFENWAKIFKNNPGPGQRLRTFATWDLPDALSVMPSVDIVASTLDVGIKDVWDDAVARTKKMPGKHFFMYNSKRPASGSFATEDDGVALRQLPWGQYKKGIERWWYWESTYYNNYQARMGETNLFAQALTFGKDAGSSSELGRTGWNYSNGDGVLFYPGTDKLYSEVSYGVEGPIASLRMKHWRRGIQDVDYLALASEMNPSETRRIVERMVPKVLWDHDVEDRSSPKWQHCDIGWSIDPDVWETARKDLAKLIERGKRRGR